jgi:hypothetical protein
MSFPLLQDADTCLLQYSALRRLSPGRLLTLAREFARRVPATSLVDRMAEARGPLRDIARGLSREVYRAPHSGPRRKAPSAAEWEIKRDGLSIAGLA